MPGASTIDVDGRSVTVGLTREVLATVNQGIPLGRPGTPEDAANGVYLLCIPESDYISGQVLKIGGGLAF